MIPRLSNFVFIYQKNIQSYFYKEFISEVIYCSEKVGGLISFDKVNSGVNLFKVNETLIGH